MLATSMNVVIGIPTCPEDPIKFGEETRYLVLCRVNRQIYHILSNGKKLDGL